MSEYAATAISQPAAGAAPAISVILCNSDGADHTLACIESLYRHPAAGSLEIILVDNASRDGCVAAVRERFPAVRVIVAPRRQGFSRNYNMGLRAASGDYLFVINNDTLVEPGTMQRLVDAMVADPRYGMVGPRMLGGDGRIQTPCLRPLPTLASYALQQLALDPAMPLGRLWQRLEQRRIAARPAGPVPCISGAAMLLSRRSLETVGLLDEAYDFYYEDIEWCHRVQRRGLLVGYAPEARIVHFGGQSSMKVKIWARQNEYLSALRYFSAYRGAGPTALALIRLATLAGFLMRGLAFLAAEALSGKGGYARDYLFLWQWLLRRPAEAAPPAAAVSEPLLSEGRP